jgi:hypothetical protein
VNDEETEYLVQAWVYGEKHWQTYTTQPTLDKARMARLMEAATDNRLVLRIVKQTKEVIE